MSTNTAEKDVKTVNDLDRHGHAPDVEIASVDDRPPEFSEEKDLRFAQFCPVPSQYNVNATLKARPRATSHTDDRLGGNHRYSACLCLEVISIVYIDF